MGMSGITQNYTVGDSQVIKGGSGPGKEKIPLFWRAAPKTESHASQLYKVHMYSCYFVAYSF